MCPGHGSGENLLVGLQNEFGLFLLFCFCPMRNGSRNLAKKQSHYPAVSLATAHLSKLAPTLGSLCFLLLFSKMLHGNFMSCLKFHPAPLHSLITSGFTGHPSCVLCSVYSHGVFAAYKLPLMCVSLWCFLLACQTGPDSQQTPHDIC